MNALHTTAIGKIFYLYNSPLDKIKEVCSFSRRRYHREVAALQDISLSVEKGETVGLVGVNGSGKSTLLKILSGVLTPTQGSYQVNGRLASLLELGAGFYPKFTGLENIEFQCALMGIPREEQAEVIKAIIAFADIGDFIYNPVRTYSSGMYVRLAFAAAMGVEPEILIVDEALAVGDAKFQSRCFRKIREFTAKGRTLIFVSHDANAVKMLCNRAYLLHQGKILTAGDPDSVIKFYANFIAAETTEYHGEDFAQRGGNGKILIREVRMLNRHGICADSFVVGEEVTIQINIEAFADIADFTVGISLSNRFGFELYGVNNQNLGVRFKGIKAGEKRQVVYHCPLDLGIDLYTLSASCHLDENHLAESFDWVNEAFVFKILANPSRKFVGACFLDARLG